QDEAGGIAQALGLAAAFSAGARSVVVLGDNVFLDPLAPLLAEADARPDCAWVALKRVPDPGRYGVAGRSGGRGVGSGEGAAGRWGDQAVAGVYVYPPDVFDVIRQVRPSDRGELEITDVNRHYLAAGRLGHTVLGGYWTDAGTPESLHSAAQLVREQPP